VSRLCAVSFTRRGKLYYLDPGPHEVRVGDMVLVPTDQGPEVAECVWAPQEVPEAVGNLPTLVGLATGADLARDDEARKHRAGARVAAKRLVREHGLAMKIVGVDYVPGASSPYTIYFTAESRVDFRQLIRDLARTLSARIELRQLSARDEARVSGGIGPCGRDTCCSTFLKDFEPVSIRMAKDQDLPLNPLKISGACGKLLCCLKYEHPLYAAFKESAPAIGAQVDSPDGSGQVVGHDVPRDSVVVRLDEGGRRCSCSKASVCAPRQEHDGAYPTGATPG